MARLITPHQWARSRTPEQWANHHVRVVAALALLLVACSYPVGVFVLALFTARHDSQAVARQAAAASPIEGSGVVLSMNDTTMTVQHTGVPSIGMAAGAAAFPTPAKIIQRTQTGDQLTFTLARRADGAYAIVSVKNAALGL